MGCMRLDGHIRMALHVSKFELKEKKEEENQEKPFSLENFQLNLK